MEGIEAKSSLLKMLDYYLRLAPFGFSDLPSSLEEAGEEGTEATEAEVGF